MHQTLAQLSSAPPFHLVCFFFSKMITGLEIWFSILEMEEKKIVHTDANEK